MATVFTHALVGGLLAGPMRVELPRARLSAFLAVIAVLPDIDVVAFAAGIPYVHPLGHRGITHSLTFGLMLAPLATSLAFPRLRRFGSAWWRVTAAAALACISHGFLDAFTDGGKGVGFFIPFDAERIFFPWRPLIVSPLGVESFASRAGPVLWSELRWVWLPVLALAGAWQFSQRPRSRS
ncbi:MAG: metal-dependent hydrolase [Deltaproteobacteria bacterium]|nr:metal-dependent hydrolase [Deltaproteobacteria bacterium]MBW2394691.1 metal-dependent hydrolase [Deltaproteobacteria bacterium]